MKHSNSSLSLAIIASGLILSVTSGLHAKEDGPYMLGGVNYWNDLEAPAVDTQVLEEQNEFGTFPPLEYKVDGSRAQPFIGVGYNLDEQWGFEVFYVSTPERLLFTDNLEVPTDNPLQTFTLSWRTTVQHTIFGVAAVYDVYLNESFSIFGKAGLALLKHKSEASLTFGGQTNPIPSSHYLTLVEEEDSTDLFGGIGARIPFRAGDASITVAYQFIETSDNRETSFEVGVQWNF